MARPTTALVFWLGLAVGCGRLGYDQVGLVPEAGGSGGPDADRPAAADAGRSDAPVSDGSGLAREAGSDAGWADAPSSDGDVGGDGAGDSLPDLSNGADAGFDGAGDSSLDIPADGPVARACLQSHPGALACWDFDDPGLQLPTQPRGTGQLDTTTFVAGRASLRASANGGGQVSSFTVSNILPAPLTSGTVYLRAHFLLPTAVTQPSWVIGMEIRNDRNPSREKVSLDFREDGAFTLNAWGQLPSGPQFPRGRWFCAELAITVHPTASAARLSIDGVPAIEATGVTPPVFEGLTTVRAGIVSSDRNPPLSLHVDEFVASTSPIGCR